MNLGRKFSDLDIIVAVITHSQIVVTTSAARSRPFTDYPPLPFGFGEVDVAMLEWIAAEGRRVGRAIACH